MKLFSSLMILLMKRKKYDGSGLWARRLGNTKACISHVNQFKCTNQSYTFTLMYCNIKEKVAANGREKRTKPSVPQRSNAKGILSVGEGVSSGLGYGIGPGGSAANSPSIARQDNSGHPPTSNSSRYRSSERVNALRSKFRSPTASVLLTNRQIDTHTHTHKAHLFSP